ncbi:MAG: beta-phosphoglucomutase family hydrolase [Clostridia bacterium]|nr:beta-phosphoglucomutase family hydrolase [Clostridia bacterium]
MIQAVIFNLDGVLVCTDECHYHAWSKLAYEQGISLQPELYLKMVGMKRMDSLKILLQGRDRSYTPQEMWALSVRKNDLFNEQIDRLDQESLLPGALETVIALKNKGVKTAVVSSSENAGGILRQLRIDHWFDVVVDGTEIEKGKPDPEVYITAARKLKMPSKECLVIENTPAGEEGARLAGMRCMMLANPYVPNEEQLPSTLAELDLPLIVENQTT